MVRVSHITFANLKSLYLWKDTVASVENLHRLRMPQLETLWLSTCSLT